MKMIIDKTADFCSRYNMLPKGGRVLCAVSGGKDSMALLHILMRLQQKFGFDLAVCHFDHQLRGAQSDRDRQFVADYCGERNLPCHVGAGDVRALGKEKGLGIEEAAREARYAFLHKCCESELQNYPEVRVATAHTADDNAETLLFNLARGTGLRGLGGILPVRDEYIRPLLEITTAEILEYIKSEHIPFVEDGSNAGDDYSRNRLRHHVLPRLRQENSGFDGNVIRTISSLREDEDFLLSLAVQFVEDFAEGNIVSAPELAKLPKPVGARVIKLMARGETSMNHIDAVFALAGAQDPHAAADIPGMRVQRDGDKLLFGVPEDRGFDCRVLREGQSQDITEKGLRISAEYISNCKEIHNSDNTFYLRHDSICGDIVFGGRHRGDKIRLPGRNCTKTLKKLFNEEKLNGLLSDPVMVFRDDIGVLGVSGFGIDERCLAKPGDDVTRINIEKYE